MSPPANLAKPSTFAKASAVFGASPVTAVSGSVVTRSTASVANTTFRCLVSIADDESKGIDRTAASPFAPKITHARPFGNATMAFSEECTFSVGKCAFVDGSREIFTASPVSRTIATTALKSGKSSPISSVSTATANVHRWFRVSHALLTGDCHA